MYRAVKITTAILIKVSLVSFKTLALYLANNLLKSLFIALLVKRSCKTGWLRHPLAVVNDRSLCAASPPYGLGPAGPSTNTASQKATPKKAGWEKRTAASPLTVACSASPRGATLSNELQASDRLPPDHLQESVNLSYSACSVSFTVRRLSRIVNKALFT